MNLLAGVPEWFTSWGWIVVVAAAVVVIAVVIALIVRAKKSDAVEEEGAEEADGLSADVALYGYYGGLRLLKAAVKKFNDYCHAGKFRQNRPIPGARLDPQKRSVFLQIKIKPGFLVPHFFVNAGFQ